MSTTIDHSLPLNNRLPAARVSYTLNNAQPVICTIIGTQPTFYMDHEDADLDRYELNEADLDLLNQESETFHQELNSFEKFSSQYALSTDEYISVFETAKRSITKPAQRTETTIDQIIAILGKSRSAQAYLDHADKYGVQLVADAQERTARYDRKTGQILINPNLSESNQVLLALYNLRRHWQHRSGALVNPMHFHPENAVLINRIQAADLISATIRGAWELQLSGYKDAWKKIENSGYADLGRAFTREAYKDFRTINSGMATTAAFEAWFLSERCRATDKKLILQMLADNQGYVFDIDNEHAALTPSIIAALGSMPFGKNYLTAHITTLMNDPIFTEVRDRSNANFLWFIKFERSFRETERDLQKEFSSVAKHSHGASPKANESYSNEEKVVVLYDGSNQPQSKPDSKQILGNRNAGQADTRSNVIYLRRAPAQG
jgi:hypothetical protein